jgi:hypothetical protein
LVLADADRRLTVAYVMKELAPFPIVTPIAAALVQRVYDIMGPLASCRAPRRSVPGRAQH